MKEKRILDVLGQVDEKYIEEAEPAKQGFQKPQWVKWGKWAAVAATACVCLAVGIHLIPDKKTDFASVGGIRREYRNVALTVSEEAIVWPWEYKTVFERFNTIVFDGREYTLKTSWQGINDIFIGEELGTGKGSGYDTYSEQHYQQDFEVWEIKGISSELMIAAEMEGQFYTFSLDEYIPPVTLGEVLDSYSLPQTLGLDHFGIYQEGEESGYYSLEEDGHIWQVLSECRDAAFILDESGAYIGKDHISFTATSEPLGVYKRVFYISADGYLGTNVFDWSYTFYIGEKAARDIIAYAEEHGKNAEREPYTYNLVGTLAEIGDDYILIDDSVLCSDEKDGMVFKVSTSDIRIRRCIDFQKIGVGSIVVIQFTEPLNIEEGSTVYGAVSMVKGYINDGSVAVPE